MRKIKDKKLISILLIVFGLSLIVIVSAILLIKEINQYSESSNIYKDLENNVIKEKKIQSSIENEFTNDDINKIEDNFDNFFVDFDKLKEEAPNVVGWIMQENTSINYPIMQTDNNDYYLNRLYNDIQNKSGSIYMDYENSSNFNDYNTIIYGHNMNDGAMFASLLEYQKQDYYDANKTMSLLTPDAKYIVEIFGAFIADTNEAGTEKSPWNLKWEKYEDYSNWLTTMQNRSLINTNVIVSSGDKIITLSTCTPTGKNRFIVMGKLVYMNEKE